MQQASQPLDYVLSLCKPEFCLLRALVSNSAFCWWCREEEVLALTARRERERERERERKDVRKEGRSVFSRDPNYFFERLSTLDISCYFGSLPCTYYYSNTYPFGLYYKIALMSNCANIWRGCCQLCSHIYDDSFHSFFFCLQNIVTETISQPIFLIITFFLYKEKKIMKIPSEIYWKTTLLGHTSKEQQLFKDLSWESRRWCIIETSGCQSHNQFVVKCLFLGRT